MKRKSSVRRKKMVDESCEYCVEILDWELPYSYSVNFNKKLIEGPYWEHMDLRLIGKMAHPEKLTDENMEVVIIGDRRQVSMLEKPEDYQEFEPHSVGVLTIRGKQSEFLGSIPFDILNTISFLLQSGEIKFLVLHGHGLYRGKAEIRSIKFSRDVDPEELM